LRERTPGANWRFAPTTLQIDLPQAPFATRCITTVPTDKRPSWLERLDSKYMARIRQSRSRFEAMTGWAGSSLFFIVFGTGLDCSGSTIACNISGSAAVGAFPESEVEPLAKANISGRFCGAGPDIGRSAAAALKSAGAAAKDEAPFTDRLDCGFSLGTQAETICAAKKTTPSLTNCLIIVVFTPCRFRF
jgi:hypothetical protein